VRGEGIPEGVCADGTTRERFGQHRRAEALLRAQTYKGKDRYCRLTDHKVQIRASETRAQKKNCRGDPTQAARVELKLAPFLPLICRPIYLSRILRETAGYHPEEKRERKARYVFRKTGGQSGERINGRG